MGTKDLLLTDRAAIRKLWNKTENDVNKDIGILKDWLQTQKHLPEIPNDNMIEFFLTNCKYSIEKTKQNLDMYYTVRSLIPELYQNTHPCLPEIEDAYKFTYCVPLPKLTPTLDRITFLKYKETKENIDVRKAFAHCLNNMYEIRAHEDLAMSDIMILDARHLSFGSATKMTPILLKQTAFILEKVQSFRMKGMYIYNMPSYMHSIVNIFKTLLSKKLSERIHTYKTIDDFTKDFPLEILPSDYGGHEKSLGELEALWKAKFLEYKDRFDKLEKMRVNEDLRPEKLKNDELLGYYGHFKKIDTD